MTILNASNTRIPTHSFNEVVYRGERVRINRRGGDAVYLVSEEDLLRLEAIEDEIDLTEARKALARHEAGGGKTVSLEAVKARLGM